MPDLKLKLNMTKKRYVVIGVSVYLVELLVIVIAIHLGMSAIFAVGLSFWVGLVVSFVLQKFVTFGDKRIHHRVLIPQAGVFCLLVLFNFIFTLVVTKLLIHFLPAVLIRTFALGATTLWNFYLYKTKIFKNDDSVIPID